MKYYVRNLQIEVKGITSKSTFTGLHIKVLGPGKHVQTTTTLICLERILS